MALDFLEAREPRAGAAGGELEPHQGAPGHQRPDVVQHQAADRRIGFCREHHPDQAAHRGSDPVDSLALARSLEPAQKGDPVRGRGYPGEQRRGVGKILRESVILLVLEPVAVAAADHVHAHDAAAPGGEVLGELVEHLAARGCRVVCMDVVGRGDSDWLEHKQDYGFTQYLSDAAALLARVTAPPHRVSLLRRLQGASEGQRIDWIGTSMGGLIGMMLAAKSDSPIRRLVLNDVGPLVPWGALVRLKLASSGAGTRFASLAE